MRWCIAFIMICMVATQPAWGAKRVADATTTEDIAEITTLLSADDGKMVAAGVEQIRELLESEPVTAARLLRGTWIPRLIEIGRCDVANELALAAMVELASDTAAVEDLQRQRIRALLKDKHNTEALAAAKGLFNVAALANTRTALLTVSECLAAVYPDDPAVLTRFRREQLAGGGGGAAGESATRPASSVLAAIAIDPAPFAAGIARHDVHRYTIPVQPFTLAMARGNMLLVAGRADEARQVFEQAQGLADETQRLEAREAIARAMRAQAGAIGPANAYLNSLRR